MKSIGLKIRGLRHKSQSSQGEIAKALGISIPAFSKIETGITDINASRMIQIAQLFNVSPTYFLEDTAAIEEGMSEKDALKEQLKLKTQEINSLQSKLIACYEEMEAMKKKS